MSRLTRDSTCHYKGKRDPYLYYYRLVARAYGRMRAYYCEVTIDEAFVQ
jgi:hypothetical protein